MRARERQMTLSVYVIAATGVVCSTVPSSDRAVTPSLGKIRCRWVLTVRWDSIEPLADLAVGQALGRELRDVQLVCGQLVACVGTAARAALAGRA